MGTLVNPIGWRLNANTFWKINFFVSNSINALAVNNTRVHYIILNNVIRKINEQLFNYGYIKFINPSVYSFAGKIVVMITFRFFSDVLFRAKFRRAYKYRKPEMRKLKRKQRKRVSWLHYAIYKRAVYSTKIKHYQEGLDRLKKYEDLELSPQQRHRLHLLIQRKRDNLWKVRKHQSMLSTRLYAKSYVKLKTFKWSRPFRIMFRMRKKKYFKIARRFRSVFFPKTQKFLKLYRWTRRGSTRIWFKNYLKRRYFKKFARMRIYIPGYGSNFYLHHKKVARQYFRKVRLFRIKRRRIRRKGLICFRYKKGPKVKKKRVRRKKKLSKARFFQKKKRFAKINYLLLGRKYSRSRFWRKRKRRRILGWRTLPRLRWSRRKRDFHNSLFYVWKLLPLLMDMKRLLKELFVRLQNKRIIEIYFLNASKPVFLDASSILDFIANFLKRRRRITKINKLFYRIIRILRFFRARYKLRGFKLLLAGRFLRRDRATYIWRTRGAVPLGSKLSKIDYAVRTIQMKYSKPIVKLWICKR